MIKSIKKINLLFLFISFLFAQKVEAAHIFIDNPNGQDLALEQFYKVDLLVNTENEYLNAFEGTITWPEEYLKFIDFSFNGSIINFWIERPEENLSNGQFKFSGIIPGGILDNEGNLLTMFFKTKQEGSGSIDLIDAKALLNDGQGTEATLSIDNFNFSISKDILIPDVIIGITDNDPPEIFQPIITKIPEIAGDNYVLVFYTQDKGLGINYYKVKEGFGIYRDAESPYLLRHQKLDVDIKVKAVDKNGNERIITIAATNTKSDYDKYKFFVIIPLLALLSFIYVYSRKLKNKNRKINKK